MPNDLERLLTRQDGLLTRDQALSTGLSRHAIDHRVRPGGPWQVVLWGVYATCTGDLTQRQRLRAGLLHAGEGACLASVSALAVEGFRYLPPRSGDAVHVLAPHQRGVRSTGFVAVTRSTRPWRDRLLDGLPVCDVARAVVDACRSLGDQRAVTAVVAEAVQRRRTTLAALERELETGPTAGTARTRRALAAVRGGARSAPEADALALIQAAAMPLPEFNADICAEDGRWLARADAVWRDVRLVLEIQSMEWHLNPEQYEATMRRKLLLEKHGWHVIEVSPRRLRTDPAGVRRDLEEAYGNLRRLSELPTGGAAVIGAQR